MSPSSPSLPSIPSSASTPSSSSISSSSHPIRRQHFPVVGSPSNVSSSTTTGGVVSSSSSKRQQPTPEQQHQHQHHNHHQQQRYNHYPPHHVFPEDRLTKTWRTLANCFIHGTAKAEMATRQHTTASTAAALSSSSHNDRPTATLIKELDEYLSIFLKTRSDWGRVLSYLEAKLEGTAQEMETIQQYARTVPVLRTHHQGASTLAAASRTAASSDTTLDARSGGDATSRKRREPSFSIGDTDTSSAPNAPKVARTST